MITVTTGNLLNSDAQTLVNTVNCVGVMGKGIALEFKKRFPAMHSDYLRRCERHEVRLGEPYLFRYLGSPWVLNFPTKDHWRSSSKVSDIEHGLDHLVANYQEWGITSIAVPPLGCGNGGLDWAVVGPLIYERLSRLTIPVEMYAPIGTPALELSESFLAGAATGAPPRSFPLPPAAVVLAAIVERITSSPAHWPIGRTTFQKIAYFATEAGLPTGLEFRRGSFGPFAPALHGITTQLVNNGVLEERRLGRMFAVEPGGSYESAARANETFLHEWESLVERVSDLFLRIPRTLEAEVAATVQFVASEIVQGQRPLTEKEIWSEVLLWKKGRLDQSDVAEAVRSLNVLGWLRATYSVELDPLTRDAVADIA